MKEKAKVWAAVLCLGGLVGPFAFAQGGVAPTPEAKTLCAGFPERKGAFNGPFCLGVVAEKWGTITGVWTTGLQEIWVLTDVTAKPQSGALWKLTLSPQGAQRVAMAKDLHHPRHLTQGPDGQLYFSLPDGVVRWRLQAPPKSMPEDIVRGLPKDGFFSEKPFVFGEDSLYVAVGAASNACEPKAGYTVPTPEMCPESESRGLVLKWQWNGKSMAAEGKPMVFSRGLRRTTGLFFGAGALFQLEISREWGKKGPPKPMAIDAMPADELNLLQEKSNYGWPFCWDFQNKSPEFKKSCDDMTKPYALFPVGMHPSLGISMRDVSWKGDWKKKILIALANGKEGHKIAALDIGTPGKTQPTVQTLSASLGASVTALAPWGSEHVLVGLGESGVLAVMAPSLRGEGAPSPLPTSFPLNIQWGAEK